MISKILAASEVSRSEYDYIVSVCESFEIRYWRRLLCIAYLVKYGKMTPEQALIERIKLAYYRWVGVPLNGHLSLLKASSVATLLIQDYKNTIITDIEDINDKKDRLVHPPFP